MFRISTSQNHRLFPFSSRRLLPKLKPNPRPFHDPKSTLPSLLHACATWCGLKWATASTCTVIDPGPDSTSAPSTQDHLQIRPGSDHKTG